jgi:transposase
MLTTKERELIVKLHHRGKTQQYIADLLECSQATVHRWIMESPRRKTLASLPRSGRPTPLTGTKLLELKELLQREISAANEGYCSLDTKQLHALVLRETKIDYSLRHIERLMHRLGFSRITPRPQHLRHDQQKVDEFRAEFKKNSKKSMWIMSS